MMTPSHLWWGQALQILLEEQKRQEVVLLEEKNRATVVHGLIPCLSHQQTGGFCLLRALL